MKLKFTARWSFVALIVVLSAGSANAALIFSEGFENPVVTGFSNTNPTGWAENGISTGGGINNDSDARLDTPFGDQALWTNGNDFTTTGGILPNVLLTNTTYTLTVNLGRRTDLSGGTYTIALLAGTTVLDSDSAAVLAASTNFSQVSTIVFTPDASHNGLLGQTLAIRLDGTTQTHFDNVQLFAVPEPTSLVMALIGLTLTAGRRRR